MTTGNALRATRAGMTAKKEAQRANRLLDDAHINRAQAAWENFRVGGVLDLLGRHAPKPGEEDLRGFEWHYWCLNSCTRIF